MITRLKRPLLLSKTIRHKIMVTSRKESTSSTNYDIISHNLRRINTDCKLRKKIEVDYKVIQVDSIKPLKSSSITESTIVLGDIELKLNDKKMLFSLTWLRDSCHCSACTHEHSRQRLFTIKDFKRNSFNIDKVQLISGLKCSGTYPQSPSEFPQGSHLAIRWTDGHESLYPIAWLSYIDSLYTEAQLRIGSHGNRYRTKYPQDDFYSPIKHDECEAKQWTAIDIWSQLKPVDYFDLIDGFRFNDEATFINANKVSDMSPRRFDAIKSLTRQLVILGLAKIENVPQERNQVLKVVKSLAYERPTGYGTVFDVVVEPSTEINLAYSSLEFDLHSDLTYREISPGVQLLHCISNSTEGGLSYFSDALNAATKLREYDPSLFEILCEFPATFVVIDPYRDVKFRRQKPVISLDFHGRIDDIYYSPFMLPPVGYKDDVKLFYVALDKFTRLLQAKENKLILKMEPGDLFMFHNRRVLHGRSAYNPKTSSRFLQGCYMDWDEVSGLQEKMSSNKETFS